MGLSRGEAPRKSPDSTCLSLFLSGQPMRRNIHPSVSNVNGFQGISTCRDDRAFPAPWPTDTKVGSAVKLSPLIIDKVPKVFHSPDNPCSLLERTNNISRIGFVETSFTFPCVSRVRQDSSSQQGRTS
ncbi:Acriflavine sensitivity control protein acr-2 [Fusarium oxysporum f. sp. albedinis]|nr:Acriflavine sensitivity control protein acr-2 [Fusarium oxysporum f. sp. albedinis]